MAEETSGAGAAAGGTLVIPGEIAARVDRLPRSWMHWEIALLIQLCWATTAATDGIAARLYPFVWLPAHKINSGEYSWLFALQGGISILIGGYAFGWLSDKIGRRKALILATWLAAVFIWPFGYVTNYTALIFLSIADTLGFAGCLAINVVYITELCGPAVRDKLILGSQVLALFVFGVILSGIIPHYMFPGQYRAFLFLLAGINIVVALLLTWRMPESPRWLEARERHDQAHQVMDRMEARVKKRHPVLPEPDLTPHQVVAEEKPNWLAPFGRQYVVTTVFILVVMALGYGGIIYGYAGYAILFLSVTRGYSAGFVFALSAWAGAAAAGFYLLNAFFGDRIERRTMVMAGAIVFAGSWYGIYNVHTTPGLYVLYILAQIGVVLWLWGMYAYIPNNFPTRMRSLGTGWTDGVGHLGAWGGVLLCGKVFLATSPLGWILLVTIPGALLPGFMVGLFGKRQHARALEELAR
jgi:putative MFS transporter